MNNLEIKQINIGGQMLPVVTSRQVAEDFEKRHSHICDTIRNLTAENSEVKNMIIESKFEHRGNEYTEYLLTRDGFSLLVMGFTGAKALNWKLKYIEAFNKMEEHIKGQAKPLSAMDQLKLQYQVLEDHEGKISEINNKIDDLENNLPLFNVECKEVQSKVKKKGLEVLGGKDSRAYKDNSIRGKVYSDIQYQLKREFGVTRYEAIKRGQLNKAIEIVEGYKVPYILGDEIIKINNQLEFEEVI